MGNNVLPARGGDLLRAFLLAPAASVRKRDVLGTVVAERLLDALALGAVFVAAVFVFVREAEVPGGGGLLAPGAAAALVLGAALACSSSSRAGAARSCACGPRSGRSRRRPARSRALTASASSRSPSLVWTLEASVYFAVGGAVGIELGPLEALYLVALTNLFALVPAAPGYVGTFDAAVLFALASLGASAPDALAYLVLLRCVLFVPITLVGLGFLVTRYGGWSRLRLARLN